MVTQVLPTGGEDGDNATRRQLLADPALLPSATTVRFAVLALMIVATTGSVYGYLGLITRSGAEGVARLCMATVSLPGASNGTEPIARVLACTGRYAGGLTDWSLAGIGLVVLVTAMGYAVTPWWLIRFPRPWIPVGRGRSGRWGFRPPWWTLDRRQALRRLDPAEPLQGEIIARVAMLASAVGLVGTEMPVCMLKRLARDTDAQVFGHRRRRYIRLNMGLLIAYRTNRPLFDATVLHELGHLRNRDTRPSHLTSAVWRVFVALVLLPYLVALVLPGVFQTPWRLSALHLRLVRPDLHILAAVTTLTALVYLTRNAVLRVREVHADAVAALHEIAGLRAAIGMHRQHGERRIPELLDNHPRLCRRLSYLDDPGRLAAPDGLAMFGAGVAVSLITVNATFMFWTGVLRSVLGGGGALATLILRAGQGNVQVALLLQLMVFGPGTLLTAVVITGLACVTAWRARLGELPHRYRPTPWRMALPLVAGFMLGQPMSVLYADAGVWGIFDTSAGWQVADLAASTAALAVLAVLVFQWAGESAVVWIPAVTGSLRRMCTTTALVGVVGVFPALFTWLITENTPTITSLSYEAPAPAIRHWFGAGWAFVAYDPLNYVEALPAAGLLFAVPVLYLVVGAVRRPATPRWLPVPAAAALLRHGRPRTRFASALAVGLVTGGSCALVGLVVMLVARATLGATAVWAGKGAGGFSLMTGWLLWITAVGCAVGAVVAALRSGAARLSAALLTAFVTATWAALLLPVSVYVGVCGQSAYGCYISQPNYFAFVFSYVESMAQVLGAIVAVVFLAGTAVARWPARLRRWWWRLASYRVRWYARLAVLGLTVLVSLSAVCLYIAVYVVPG